MERAVFLPFSTLIKYTLIYFSELHFIINIFFFAGQVINLSSQLQTFDSLDGILSQSLGYVHSFLLVHLEIEQDGLVAGG